MTINPTSNQAREDLLSNQQVQWIVQHLHKGHIDLIKFINLQKGVWQTLCESLMRDLN